MKWEKIAQRENDFLKNYLAYEAFEENFPKVHGRNHPCYMTIRNGMSYTIYYNKESSAELAKFLSEQKKKNPQFMRNLFIEGKKHFDNLINFCSNFGHLKNKSNNQLLESIKNYFRLIYKIWK